MLTVHNSLSKKKEVFKPQNDQKVTMYVCGPTVYDVGHLGHGRAAVSFDIIRRYLIWKGFDVNFVSNVTDIDDKMINRAREEGITVKELADRITPEYERDFSALGIMAPTERPKATEYVSEMIEIIRKLEEKGATYVTSDGVYFDVTKFPEYGKLSGQKLDALEAGARVEMNKEKRGISDFVLWKFEKPGEPAWDSPWGRGRPGWHIECSAMSSKLLGETIDIHGGGADLMFPHHECEIAQSELANGKPFARYFLHNGFINVNAEKMSKSLGNFVTLKKIFEMYSPRVVRLLYLQTHYRSPINFDDTLLQQAKNTLERYDTFLRRLKNYPAKSGKSVLSSVLDAARKKFEESMDDDFETTAALASAFELMREANTLMDLGKLIASDVKEIFDFFKNIDAVFSIMPEEENIPEEILNLIQKREEARKNKDFATSDLLRNQLLQNGIEVEDTPHGTLWKRR